MRKQREPDRWNSPDRASRTTCCVRTPSRAEVDALDDRDPAVYTRYVQVMDGNPSEAPSGRERVSQGRTEAEARANVVDALLLILRSDAGSVVDAVRESQVLPEPVGQRFDTRVSLGESEATVGLSALRLIGAGDTFDAAVDDLVEVLREYSSQYLRRIVFDRQAAQGNLSPLIRVFSLTPAEEQRGLLLRPPTATAGASDTLTLGGRGRPRTRWKPNRSVRS